MHKEIKKILNGKSRRFRRLHAYFEKNYGDTYLFKIIALLLGVIFVLVGFILLFLPGPGLLFLILGVGFISLLSKKLAHYLDKLEIACRQLIKRWMKKYNKSEKK